MRLLAFDLAYVGATGFVQWNTDQDDPVMSYGEVIPINSKKPERDVIAVWDLYSKLREVIAFESIDRLDYIVYEITDWHRNLNTRSKNWTSEYAIERLAQRTLGRAESALIIAAQSLGYMPIAIGANEAKKEFGYMRKDACAHAFAAEYPRFRFIDTASENAKEFLYDALWEKNISNHISDSFIIAKVMAARLTQQERADV